MGEVAIRVGHVSKTFKLPHEKQSSIKGALINIARGGNRSYEKQRVLNDVSFEIKKGEFFGIVGRNGSGKSTLLKLLAGIYVPTKGSIQVNGKLTPFIELGVGFNPELTGRENVFLNGALLGFNRKEMIAMYNSIVLFAELEKFMDQKLKNYSSGMQVRLAFSIATRAQSDILLIDEVLAVGDALFQQKCFDYFKELKKQKRTVVFVSHDSAILQQYCDRGVLIEKGDLIREGPISEVINDYREILNQVESQQADQSRVGTSVEKRWGRRDITVERITIANRQDKSQKLFVDTDDMLRIAVTYRAHADCLSPNYGITINDSMGQQVFASNTAWSRVSTADVPTDAECVVTWEVPNIFNSGSYEINPAVSDPTGNIIYDWRDSFSRFKIRKTLPSTAVVNVAHNVWVSAGK